MKKVTRRILAFALALTLMLALAGTASAATVTWISLNRMYSATVSKTGDWYYIYRRLSGATRGRHVQGTDTLITWPTGSVASYSVSFGVGNSVYESKLEDAAEAEGLVLGVSSAPLNYDYYVIPAALLSGEYSFGIEITVYDVEWSVTAGQGNVVQSVNAILTESEEGTLGGVPASCTLPKLIPGSG